MSTALPRLARLVSPLRERRLEIRRPRRRTNVISRAEALENRQLMAGDIVTAPFGTLSPAGIEGSLVYGGEVQGEFESQTPDFVSAESGGLQHAEKVLFHNGDLYVTSRGNHQVMRYDGATGAPKPADGQSGAVFATGGGLNSPIGLAFGPDGNLYVANYTGNNVVRFSPAGAALGTFVAAGAGGLNGATGLAFDSSGRLYVGSLNSDQVMRYSTSGAAAPAPGKSGAVFASGGGLDGPDSLTFGPDGRLYVTSQSTDQVISYAASNGAPASAPFLATGSGIDQPLDLEFGADGSLYITSFQTHGVKRYQGPGGAAPGAFLGDFVPSGAAGLATPTGLTFGPDGALYVTNRDASRVLRFDGSAPGPGDVDEYTLEVEANQTIALQYFAPASSLALSHSTLGTLPLTAESDSTYSPVYISQPGVLTIRVQAADGWTVGGYSVGVLMNAQRDLVSGGASAVQSLAPSSLDVDAGSTEFLRAAATGNLETVTRVLQETEGVSRSLRGSWDRTGVANTWALNHSGNPNTSLNKGVTGSLNKSGSTSSNKYDAADRFTFVGQAGDTITIRGRGSNSGGGTLTKVLVRLYGESGALLASGAAVTGAASDTAITSFTLPASGTYSIGVETDNNKKGTYTLLADLVSPTDPRANSADIYEWNVTSPGYISASLAAGDFLATPQATISLYAPGVDPESGTPVAVSSMRGTLDGVLEYNATAAGAYRLKVATTSGAPSYWLAATQGGVLDNTLGVSAASAQDLTGREAVLGQLTRSTVEFVASASGGLNAPVGAAFGPDGNLYVAGRDNNAVLRFDGATGAYLNVFASGGNLSLPEGLVFGPDSTGDSIGELYVASRGLDAVLRYNGATGAYIDRFVASGSGGLNDPHGLAFGPDGNLYIPNRDTGEVLQYDGASGAFLGVFTTGGPSNNYVDLTFGPDDNLYVSGSSNTVNRYNGLTGEFIDEFVTAGSGGLFAPRGLTFGPDGDLYVGQSARGNQVFRYDSNGAFVESFIAPSAGLDEPIWVIFGADGSLYTTDHVKDRVMRTLPVAQDYYRLDLAAGQQVRIATSTPGDAPGQVNNFFDPSLSLLDGAQSLLASGTPLADGRNEEITFTASAAGTYYIRLGGSGDLGTYLLRVEDQSAELTASTSSRFEQSLAADEVFASSGDDWLAADLFWAEDESLHKRRK